MIRKTRLIHLKVRRVKVCKYVGEEKFCLEKEQVQRLWGRNRLGGRCVKKQQGLEQSRREGRGRRCLHRGRLGKERSSRALRAIIGNQAFTLRKKEALLRRELLRVLRREVVCGLLF